MPSKSEDRSDSDKPSGGGRRVVFSQGGLKSGGGQLSVTAAIIPIFMLWGSIAGVMAFFGLGRFPWLPAWARATAITIVFLTALIFMFRVAARGYKRVTNSIKLPMEMDPSADLNVVCWPDQKTELERDIPTEGTEGAFEPEVFRVWITRRTPISVRLMENGGQRRETVRIIALVLSIQAVVISLSQNWVAREPVIAILTLAAISPFTWAFIAPSYLRVVPGRLDIVRYRPGLFGIGGQLKEIERIDLRDQPVRLDVKRKELLVGGWHESHGIPDQGPEPGLDPAPDPKPGTAHGHAAASDDVDSMTRNQSILLANQKTKDPQGSLGSNAQIKAVRIVPIWGTMDMRRATRALFRAAISKAVPGPVPDNALLES